MIFERISLTNYRCFKSIDIVFQSSKEKPITLFVGANGTGKSEFLYSFQWILYDVDFLNFKGKQQTAISLNLDSYDNLKARISNEEICKGELFFESRGSHYRVIKTETFRISKNGIPERKMVEQYLQQLGSNNSWNSIASGVEQVRAALNPIIPESLLSGIIFDGEEMLEIASPDPNLKSKQNGLETIKGVIAKITDNRLISLAYSIFVESRRQIDNTISKKYKGVNKQKVQELEKTKRELEDKKTRYEGLIQSASKELNSLITLFETKKANAEKAKAVQKLFVEKEIKHQSVIEKEREKENILKNFQDCLKKGYFLITDNLVSNMSSVLELKDIPEGLTVAAAQNIMKMDTCICGEPMTEKARKAIEKLLPFLPPANISAQLREEVSGISYEAEQSRNNLKKSYEALRIQREAIRAARKDEEEIIAELQGYSDQTVNEIIRETLRIEREIEDKNSEIRGYKDELQKTQKQLELASNEFNEIVSKSKECEQLTARLQLYEKFINVIDDFKKRQHQTALNAINSNLDSAYKQLSEDYEKERRLIIGRYASKNKYQLMPYIIKTVQKAIEQDKRIGTYAKEFEQYKNVFNDSKTAEEALFESYVANAINPSSTGQLSIATLSFIKAVLDYSTKVKADVFTQNESYPLVLDSPLSNIGDTNLEKVGRALPYFAEQIIYLTTATSYSLIEENVKTKVKKTFILKKESKDDTYSIITEV